VEHDVEEPDAHIFLKPVFSRREAVLMPDFRVGKGKCAYCGRCAGVSAYNAVAVSKIRGAGFTEICHGCGACSYLCTERAISSALVWGVAEYCLGEGIPVLRTISLEMGITSFHSNRPPLVEGIPQ